MDPELIERQLAVFASLIQEMDLAFEETNACPFCGHDTDEGYYESLRREQDWFQRTRQEKWDSFLVRLHLDADKYPCPPVAKKGFARGIALVNLQPSESTKASEARS